MNNELTVCQELRAAAREREKNRKPLFRRIYVAGPMRGRPDQNRRAFLDAEEFLFARGYSVVNPVKVGADFARMNGAPVERLDEDPSLLRRCMEHELRLVGRCHEIYLLRGWETSEGARRECAAALALGLRVQLQPEGFDRTI